MPRRKTILSSHKPKTQKTAPSNWKIAASAGTTVNYPPNWRLDASGNLGANYFIYSPSEGDADNFAENINFLTQYLKGQKIDLEQYTQISLSQLDKLMPGAKLLSNKLLRGPAGEYQKVVYTARQQGFDMEFMQHYFIKKGSAYVLTFTGLEISFEKYSGVAEKIMNTFRWK